MSPQGWFDFWEIVTAAGTAAVITGLFIEYGLGIFSFLKFWGKREIAELHVKIETPWERKGSALVVFGIAIELVGSIGIFVQSLRIETENRRTVAALELKAAQLQKAVAWRLLSLQQQQAIAATVKPFKESIDILVYFSDLEAWVFADQIGAAIGNKAPALWIGGWNVHFGLISMSPRLLSGMLIETTSNATDKDRAAANALVKALHQSVTVVRGPQSREDGLKGETISGDVDVNAPIILTVGVHPRPPLELEMPVQ